MKCKDLYDLLVKNGIDFFCGVPDSTLKDILAYILDNTTKDRAITAANEGNAIALASGYYLGTGRIPLVYMQNSGQGNALNPLASLTHQKVYSIPMLLMIGWRGEPGKKDEPQHLHQGAITKDLLDILNIPYSVLPETIGESEMELKRAIAYMQDNRSPYALIVSKGSFEIYKSTQKTDESYELTREDAIKLIIDNLSPSDIVVSTTGKTSRELYEYRDELDQKHNRDFLTVGSMGHSSSIALGIALAKPDRNVYCFDGDGALIMHMGSLAIIGSQNPKNFRHIIFNNGAHDSVGGQPTVGNIIDIPAIAKANGYNCVLMAEKEDEILNRIALLDKEEGPCLLEVKVKKGARSNLGRPRTTPIENKESFMAFLNEE